MEKIYIEGVFEMLLNIEGEAKEELEMALNEESKYESVTITKESLSIRPIQDIVIKGWKDFYNYDMLCYFREKTTFHLNKDEAIKYTDNFLTNNQIAVLKKYIRVNKIKPFI